MDNTIYKTSHYIPVTQGLLDDSEAWARALIASSSEDLTGDELDTWVERGVTAYISHLMARAFADG